MTLESKGRGGWRGGGRPKKKKSDLQNTHSIRATNSDWKILRQIIPVIKGNTSKSKKPRVFMLTDEDEAKVNQLLLGELIEHMHEQRWGEEQETAPLPSPPTKEALSLQKPKTIDEQEAVSLFLELFHMNPQRAISANQQMLEKERRIAESKKRKKEQEQVMNSLDERIDTEIDKADKVN